MGGPPAVGGDPKDHPRPGVRPRIIDTFPFAGTPTELLLLECRLTELYDAVDAFVIVEANVDHQDHPKPLNFLEHQDQFAAWKDKICYVVAETLPTLQEDDWSWAREHAQREWVGLGLDRLEVTNDDIILHGDMDEIPSALAARNMRPQRQEMISFDQRGHFWAIDWLYPPGWCGTVATRAETLMHLAGASAGPFAMMRNSRNLNGKHIPGGWHFSWLGGPEAWDRKVGSFCHPEVEDRIRNGEAEKRWQKGIHVDHIKMIPVDIDRTWPKWMQNPDNVPPSWLRPR